MSENNEESQLNNVVETIEETGQMNNSGNNSRNNSVSDDQVHRASGNGSVVQNEPKSESDHSHLPGGGGNLDDNCETMDNMEDTLRLCPGHYGKDGDPVIEFTPMGVYKNSKREPKNLCIAWFYDCLECCF